MVESLIISPLKKEGSVALHMSVCHIEPFFVKEFQESKGLTLYQSTKSVD